MIITFWKKLSINVVAVVVPAALTIPGFGLLVRVADDATVGSIMWTWFLMGTAGTLNAGLNPALTNEFGAATAGSVEYQSLTSRYIRAANVIYGTLLIIGMLWSLNFGTQNIAKSIVAIQLLIIWATGVSALLMTTLNFQGHAYLTARSKLIYNSLIIFAPVAVLAAGGPLAAAVGVILGMKIFQLWRLARNTTVLADQAFRDLKNRPIGFRVFHALLRKQWRLVVISIAQLLVAFIDRFAVSSMFGIEAYKSYSGIQDLLTKVWMLSSIFIILLHPIFAEENEPYANKLQISIHYSRWLFLIGTAGITIGYLNLEAVLYYVFDLPLSPDTLIICRNLSLGIIISLSYMLFNTLLIAAGEQNFVLKLSVGSLIIYGIVLVPVMTTFGLVGLSYMFLVKFTLEAAVFHMFIAKQRWRGAAA